MSVVPQSISVIIPVGARHADATVLHAEYRAALAKLSAPVQIIYVLDGQQPDFAAGLRKLLEAGEQFTVISLTRTFGEATAIMAGFAHATGEVILTLPAYQQIEASEAPKLLEALEGHDLVIGRRWPRVGGPLEKMRRWAFHRLLASVTKLQYRDLACGARAFRRVVLEEISLYGDQHRFLAVLAERQGFRIREIDLRQSDRDRRKGGYGPREYLVGFLDIFSVFFLVRFTKKPLRFFGMVGVTTFSIGLIWALVIVLQRLFFEQALADRPALLMSSLLIVLGLQVFAIGLLGELIIFTHARGMKDYQIAEVIEFPAAPVAQPGSERSGS